LIPHINFYSEEADFCLKNEPDYLKWLGNIAQKEEKAIGDLNFIFCNDDYLHSINLQYLNHDTYTDIITFPFEEGEVISGDIYISIDRVKENAISYKGSFEEELQRVMAHGVLHLCGYGDKTKEESIIMRSKEEAALALFEKIS
jgi:rRNA maturation RNase YbeY